MNGVLWSLITVVGPLLLIGVIVWAFLRNWKSRPEEIARSERGARDLRQEIEQDEARRRRP